MPILRPLIGHNKTEIIDLARRLGTYELSIRPQPDCCALLAGTPRTRTEHSSVDEIERSFLPDYDGLVERTLREASCPLLDCGRIRRLPGLPRSKRDSLKGPSELEGTALAQSGRDSSARGRGQNTTLA